MSRIFLVDDSASARALLGVRLRERGFEVIEIATAAEAAERAGTSRPDAIVTDLWMPGISGLQLCRILRSDPATALVPVVLLTATDDRRSRFWARQAGASAYVTKSEIDHLIELLLQFESRPPSTVSRRPATSTTVAALQRGSMQERLSQLLDATLFETTIAGEVRALAQRAEEIEELFDGLATLASEVIAYRWLALVTEPVSKSSPSAKLLIHTHEAQSVSAEREARDALDLPPPAERRKPPDGGAVLVADRRPVEAEWSSPPMLLPVLFGPSLLGRMAISPSRRGASHEEQRFSALLANELGGPLRMTALVAEARRLASTDTLTGLLNRRAFLERMEHAKEAAVFPMSVLLLDVDHFKKVNDTFGHDAGDAVLQGVARVLSGVARRSDIVARWGGEEFVVALANTAEPGARVAAERVRRAIAEAKYTFPDGTEHQATASVGLASAEDESWHFDALLARADKAMYAAKHRGRNRIEIA